jgi:formylglycine-generating enzyme required for sulfatase activity
VFHNKDPVKKILFLLCLGGFVLDSAAQPDTPEGMVLIPGGSFVMGSDANPHSPAFPAHRVSLKPFYMDIWEVTNTQYATFCEATGRSYPEFWGMAQFKSGPDFPDYPVLGVNQADAEAYAAWTGKRLPTEAEWEFAARGGVIGRDFPYGDQADHGQARFNHPEKEKGPVPVGTFKPNGYGLYDMAGNVWEWVADWYDEDYYENSPGKDPAGPASGQFKAFRGGGWHSGGGCTRVDHRNALPMYWVDMAGGFRCVKDLE